MLKYTPGRERRNGIKVIIPVILFLMVFSCAFLQEKGSDRRGMKTFATEITEKNLLSAAGVDNKPDGHDFVPPSYLLSFLTENTRPGGA
jgi:hypothetical protein